MSPDLYREPRSPRARSAGALSLTAALLTALLILPSALEAKDFPLPEYPEFFPADSAMASPALHEEGLRESRQQLQIIVNRKLKIADTLFKMKRYRACADICEEIKLMDPSCVDAVKLREKALKAMVTDELRSAESDMHTGADRQLLSNLEDSITPQKGPVRERPTFNPNCVPFADRDAASQVARGNILGQKILEEISLNEAPLSEVLQLLFKVTGINIIYKPDAVADKTVSIHGRNLQLSTVLDYLVRTCEIGYKVEKDMIWIYAKSAEEADEAAMRAHMTTVVIPLQYGLTPYPKAPDEEALTGGNDSTSLTAKGISADPDNEANPTDIGTMLTWMESSWPGWPKESKWFIDRKLNRLVIVSTPDIIEEVRKIVKMLDVPPVQVLITSQFVSINEEDYDAMGFDFGFRSIDGINYNGRGGKWSYQAAINPDTGQSTTDIFPADVTPSTTFGLTATIDQFRLSAIMKALKQKKKGRVVNAPRVIAYNNHAATIKIVTTHHYATDIDTESYSSSTDRTSSSSTSFVPTNYQDKEVGWILEVLPSIGFDMKTISMRIVPKVTVEDGQEDRLIYVGNANSGIGDDTSGTVNLPIPLFRESSLDVNVSVEDGKTVVIGGLYTSDDSSAERGTPVLKDIPVVGNLFKARSNTKERNALLIFVTAKIVRPDNGTYTDTPMVYPALDPRDDGHLFISNEKLNRWLGDPVIKPESDNPLLNPAPTPPPAAAPATRTARP
ncbi:MAG: hypothetical protein J6333_00885, partial [Planctomycetes bacterium]|nr:hypothetical protein [Planctomycetota bacterium]